METLAASGDGQAEARRATHFRQRRLSMGSLLASAWAPLASLAVLSEAGRLVPDAHDAPFHEGSFHARSEAGMEERFASSTAIMAQHTSWATVDLEAEKAAERAPSSTVAAEDGTASTSRPAVLLRPAACPGG